MKKFVQTLALFAACAVASCGPKASGDDIPVVDVTKSYPQKEIVLQEVAEVEYVPLETCEGFLVDNLKVSYMDDRMVVIHNQNGDIMMFDRHTGRGITSFNREGRGPGEYSGGVGYMAVDGEVGEIFVTPGSLSGGECPMCVYDLTGKHLRTLPFKDFGYLRYFYNYDDDYLFGYSHDPLATEPHFLLSKTDTIVMPMPLDLPERGSMALTHNFEGGYTMTRFGGQTLAKADPGLMISEPGTDTIFHWTGRELIPLVAQTPSFGSMSVPRGIFFLAQTGDYMFLQTVERKYDWDAKEGFKTVDLIYDKSSGEFFEGAPVNTDFADNRAFRPNEGPAAGVFVQPLQPFELLDLHKAGKLRGRLAEIAPTLKEDDNPVMMIVTFKTVTHETDR